MIHFGIPPFRKLNDAGIWIRTATRSDAARLQLDTASAYVVAHDGNIREVYDLVGQSGISVLNHPEVRRLMDDIKRSRIRSLVVTDVARLSRNLTEVQQLVDFVESHNADVISIN
jgi:DNA invertase Pin-like site-specific DNA recombinase